MPNHESEAIHASRHAAIEQLIAIQVRQIGLLKNAKMRRTTISSWRNQHPKLGNIEPISYYSGMEKSRCSWDLKLCIRAIPPAVYQVALLVPKKSLEMGQPAVAFFRCALTREALRVYSRNWCTQFETWYLGASPQAKRTTGIRFCGFLRSMDSWIHGFNGFSGTCLHLHSHFALLIIN